MSPIPRSERILRNTAGSVSTPVQMTGSGFGSKSHIHEAESFIRQGLAQGFASWPRRKRELGTKSTIGLSMIPLGIFVLLVVAGFFIWHSKRRALREETPPPVPEKDYPPGEQTVGAVTEPGRKRGSRVFNMAAFTTPIHRGQKIGGQKREASVIGQSPDKKSAMHGPQRRNEAKAVRLVVPEDSTIVPEALRDSPVDGGSPFRLKPDDGTKRLSLGTEISKVWPSPPPAIWIGTPEGGVSPRPTRTRIVPSRILTDTEAEIIGMYSRSWYLPADYETSR